MAVAAVPAAASTASPLTNTPPGATRLVTLVTGDVISVATEANGRQEASVVKRASTGAGAVFQAFTLGSDLYVVPESAVPYLGTTLDLSLFDVTQLAASPSATNVQITYRSAAAPTAVPGITVAGRSGTSAQGVVKPASASAFGVALERQWQADHAAASHTTGLFASVARISAAAPAAAAQGVQPSFVMHTLTVNGRDQHGKKDTGDDVVVYNVDDLSNFAGEGVFFKGAAKLSVPAGDYAAVSFFFDGTTVREVASWQFTVAGDTSISIDAQDATAPVTFTPPKPANPQVNEVGIGRTDALGQTATFTFLGGGTTAFEVQPTTQPVTIGQLHFFTYTRQVAADNSYSYDLEFPTEGAIPADENYSPQASDLAAVDSSYPASVASTPAGDTRFGALPWQSFLFASDLFFTTPVQRTEYYTAFPDISWQGVYYAVFELSPTVIIQGQYQSAWRTYQPGQDLTTTWGNTPAGPRLLQAPIFVGQTVCPACVNGTNLALLGYPYGDSSADHFGFPSGDPGESQSYAVSADGTVVQQGSFLDASVAMPASAQTYGIEYDTTRSSPDFLLSTAVQTKWTVPASVPTSSLPAGWVCDTSGSTTCGVLPLITSSYNLPVSLLGQLPAGASTGELDLGHLASAAIAFSSVQVNVSYDGGQTWQPVTVTSNGAGQYGLTFTVPDAASTDGYGALQVSVTDAAGGTFNQTIQHAFAIGS